MSGNISSLHWYYRQRVTEENVKPFGRLVGLGTLLIGIAMIAFGILFLIYEKTQLNICVIMKQDVQVANDLYVFFSIKLSKV